MGLASFGIIRPTKFVPDIGLKTDARDYHSSALSHLPDGVNRRLKDVPP
jgi:hypothetical protein